MKTMKFIYRFILILSALALAASCVEKVSDADILAGRDRTTIEVSYALGGTEVKSVTVASASIKKTLEVTVNNENLKWNLESNRDWCEVVSEEHCGSGTVTLNIAANEDFEAREPATLTFVAGDYRGFQITVNQNAAAFIIGQPYFVSGIDGGSYNVNVTTPAGTDWTYDAEDWMEVTEGTPSSNEEFTTTPLTIKAAANDGASRYGTLNLSAGEEAGYINIYQFGTELTYEEGSILLEGTEGAGLTLTAPAYVVNSVKAPKFAAATVTENGNGTSTVNVVLKENLSDCSENREVELSLQLANASATIVELPSIVQDYIPANGLVTGKGMMAFAKAVAEGQPTTDWEDNGVVTVKGEIDMSEVEGWTGIGTADSPFKGKFNGGGFEITDLKNTSAGLFAYCEGATIQNVVLGKGCSLYYDKSYTGLGGAFGGIVSVAKKTTTVTACQFDGAMDFAGTNDNDEPAYIGGIVGYADETSTVTKSKMNGNITLSSGYSQMLCYVGGLAGKTEGTISNTEMTGKLRFSSGISELVAGGITSVLSEKTVVSGNSFMGELTLGGTSSNVILGGLYGSVSSDRNFDDASDKSVTLGNISIDSFASAATTEVFAGGFVGKAEAGVALSFKGYECQTNISLDQSVNRAASNVFIGGVLGGCDIEDAAKSVSFENVSNSGVYSTDYTTTASIQIAREFIGGIAGFVNGAASFKSCVNNGEIGKLTSAANCANTKNYIIILGGIAGVVVGADAEFVSCENKAAVTNKHYSNCHPKETATNGWYNSCIASGILGAFENRSAYSAGKLVMTSCVNNDEIVSYRGAAAGIVGYARNAQISSCSNWGSLGQNSTNSNNSAYKGGIACTLTKSTIDNCTVKCDVFCSNPATEIQSPGGILALSISGGVTVKNCAYYGNITINKGDQPLACGGVVAVAQDDTVVEGCKFGGKINGIEASANNVESLAVGNGLGNVSNITLWNGTL